jgi:hypothetical protein
VPGVGDDVFQRYAFQADLLGLTPEQYFDVLSRSDGFVYDDLDDATKAAYDTAKATYVGLHWKRMKALADPRVREREARLDALTDAWIAR